MHRRSSAMLRPGPVPSPKCDFHVVSHPPCHKPGVVVPFRRTLRKLPKSVAIAANTVAPTPPQLPAAPPPFMWTEEAFAAAREDGKRMVPLTAHVSPEAVAKAATNFRKGALAPKNQNKRTLGSSTARHGPMLGSSQRNPGRAKPKVTPKKPAKARPAQAEAPLPLGDDLYAKVVDEAIGRFQTSRVHEPERVMSCVVECRGGSRTKARDALRTHLVNELCGAVSAATERVTKRMLTDKANHAMGQLVQHAWDLFAQAQSIRDEPQVAKRLKPTPLLDVLYVHVETEGTSKNVDLYFLVEVTGKRSTVIQLLMTERPFRTWLNRPARSSRRSST